MPSALHARIETKLPRIFNEAKIARLYNLTTGANLSHWDIHNLSIYDLNDVILLVDNSGIVH